MTAEDQKALKEFREGVNMSATELSEWLKTPESKQVGFKEEEDNESVGHESGRKIVKILQKKQADYTAADLAHIHKVVGYIHRHLAQRPDGDITGNKLAIQPDELGPRSILITTPRLESRELMV